MRPSNSIARPAPFRIQEGQSEMSHFTKDGWKGMVCPQCGGCSSRTDWNGWFCTTEGCGYTHIPKKPIISAPESLRGTFTRYDGSPPNSSTYDEGYINEADPLFVGHYRITKYTLSKGNFIFHFQANQQIQMAANGPDKLFTLLQQEDIGLKRHVVGSQTGRTAMLTRHFAVNYGMPYKYIVGVDSQPFSDAPDVLLNCLQRLRWAGKHAGQEDKKFNELLVVGYFQDSRMGFHDDGEKDLGPTIATLSLGCPASMRFRMKAKYHRGPVEKGGQKARPTAYDPHEPVLPGSAFAMERNELNKKFKDGKTTLSQLQTEWATILQALDARSPGSCPVLLDVTLHHGDMIIMHGAELQKYYEHAVEPVQDGYMRFALTARHIMPNEISEEHRLKGHFDESAFPEYDGAKDSWPL